MEYSGALYLPGAQVTRPFLLTWPVSQGPFLFSHIQNWESEGWGNVTKDKFAFLGFNLEFFGH